MSGTEATTSAPETGEKAPAPAAQPSSPAATETAAQPSSPAVTETAATPAATIAAALPSEHWTHGPEETDIDDNDSAVGIEAESTASLSSTILKYRTIYGRRYHSEIGNAVYWGANDEGHNESLDILHHVFTLTLDDKLFLAPLEDPKSVLDIGTGTGIWAIDFADIYTGCEVIGTDISPIQPSWVPPNLRFEIEDCTQEWTFPHNSFDFVHIRYLGGCIQDWTALFKEAYKCLKPGGWLQSFEGSPNIHSEDATMPPGSALAQSGPLFEKGSKLTGRSVRVVDDEVQGNAVREAGFVDLHERDMKVPIGGWPADPHLKEIGQFSRLAILNDIDGYMFFLANLLGWSEEQIKVFIAHIRKELRAMEHNYYYRQKVVWAQKPEA